MSITRLKATRTRYRSLLEKEITICKELLQDQQTDSSGYVKSTKLCIQRLTEFRDKVEATEDSLSLLLEQEDKAEEIQRIVEEDCDLYSDISECLFELNAIIDNVHKGNTDPKVLMDEDSESKTTTMEHFMNMQIQMQQQMQQLFITQQEQIKQQHDTVEMFSQKKSNEISVKLPKLELPSFSGDRLKWSEFWDSFESTIHTNHKLSNIEKFNYLSSKLYGEARRAVSGLSLTNDNYLVAVGILRERFGETQCVISSHYEKLINLPEASTKTVSLRALYDKFETHLRSLEALGQDIDQAVFISLITSKLPKEVLTHLEIQKGAKTKWNIQKLREMLENYIVAKEKAEQQSKTTEKQDYQTDKTKSKWNKDTGYVRYTEMRDKWNTGHDLQHGTRQYKSSAEALFTGQKYTTKTYSDLCRFCEGKHYSDECQRYKTLESRKQQLKGCCYICLKGGHTANNCRADKICVYCKKRNHHHRSLCPEKFQHELRETVHLNEESCNDTLQAHENVLVSSDEIVLMQTATTKVRKPGEQHGEDIRVLLDSGSQRTYITETMAKKLQLTIGEKQTIQLVTFGSEKPQTIQTPTTQVQMRLVDDSYITITANIVPKICGQIFRRPISATTQGHWQHLTSTLTLADSLPLKDETSSIDLLIGNDYYLDIIILQRIEIQPGLNLLGSRLGWILTGRTSDTSSDNKATLFVLTYGSDIERETSIYTEVDEVVPKKPAIEEFWKLETIGITDPQRDEGDDYATQRFSDTIRYEDNRYYLTWPWKEEELDLPENYQLALGRLKTLIHRMRQNPDLLAKYDSIIQEQLKLGIIEKVPVNNDTKGRHYIPHHAVVHPEKSTTKVRIVYDASAKTRQSNKSLNECLYRGPVLLKDLVGLLLRFRLKKIALVADIEKAFLQLGLQPQERDVTRFIWLKDLRNLAVVGDNLQEFRFCRIPFGIKSSPYLLAATIEHHLQNHGSKIADQIRQDIYVDNVISGANSTEEAIDTYKEAKDIFQSASMNLRDWMSNDKEIMDKIPESDKAKVENMKILGHVWNVKEDTLAVRTGKGLASTEKPSKREVLKQVASVYDPMGLLSPVILKGKLLLKQLWSSEVKWDQELPSEEIVHWKEICADLQEVTSISFPRFIGLGPGANSRILCFCDASKSAYATTVYLHQTCGDQTRVDLLFAKSRVSPIKEMSIPRLELLAVLIGTRAIQYVNKQLQIAISDTYLWTDSQCVLHWINSSKTLSRFVQNRIDEIRKSKGVIFGHVQSKNNPADIASRGTTTKELKQLDIWWHGPKWVQLSADQWTNETEIFEQATPGKDAQREVRENFNSCEIEFLSSNDHVLSNNTQKLQEPPFNLDSGRFSSKRKLLRVTAYVVRFIGRIKRTSTPTGNLTSAEIEDAENMWIAFVQGRHYYDVIESIKTGKPNSLKTQLGLYLDTRGIIRCTGRLQNAALSEAAKQPILLPRQDEFTRLVIQDLHKQLLHAGVSQTLSAVRQKFWIPHGRSSVKSVIKKCSICRRYEGGPYRMPPMPQLPAKRVTESPPFSYTGVDYLGPMYVKSNQEARKVWICLYTCLVTRAIHLELMMDMTTEQFLLGLRRFIARHGKPVEITSDNAAHFKLASEVIDKVWDNILGDEEITTYVSNEGIKWKFIVELAPWMGGYYERLVSLVKRSLRKAIGKLCLTSEQLLTYLQEAEAVINSRPITYVGDDINSTIALTPSHFLTLNQYNGIPECEGTDSRDPDYFKDNSTAEKLTEKWKKGQKLLNQFWKIWTNDYLVSLRERYQTTLKSCRVQYPDTAGVGDVVLVKDELPRGTWKMGRIEELITSGDGQVRSARVKLPNGRVLGRALKFLFPIECPAKPERMESKKEGQEKEQQDRRERPQRRAAEEARNRLRQMFESD